ncbi:MAG: response regulator [Burkholderiales bacterium]
MNLPVTPGLIRVMQLQPHWSRPRRDILLVDDHALIREGWRAVLSKGFVDVNIVEAGSLAEALLVETATPKLVLLDVNLPGINGVDGLAMLRAKWRDTPVVVISSSNDPEVAERAMANGAVAFLSKEAPLLEIVTVVDKVLRGRPVASAQTSPELPSDAPASRLTGRQCEVLELLCNGLSNKAIGRQLNLTENTIRTHVQAVLAHLDVASRAEAMVAARRRGLVR